MSYFYIMLYKCGKRKRDFCFYWLQFHQTPNNLVSTDFRPVTGDAWSWFKMVVTSTYRKKQKKKRPNDKIPFRKEEIR